LGNLLNEISLVELYFGRVKCIVGVEFGIQRNGGASLFRRMIDNAPVRGIATIERLLGIGRLGPNAALLTLLTLLLHNRGCGSNRFRANIVSSIGQWIPTYIANKIAASACPACGPTSCGLTFGTATATADPCNRKGGREFERPPLRRMMASLFEQRE
jgi:hypothetical protein